MNTRKNFKALKRDGAHSQINTGNQFSCLDASDVSKKSPYTFTTDIDTINIPDDAAEIFFKASKDLKVSDLSDQDSYFIASADTWHGLGVANLAQLYIAGDSEGGTLQFYFVTI